MSYRVFVSAVTKELGAARAEVTRLLRRKGLDVTVQEDFRQGGGVLLEKLRDEIGRCDAVLCLIGDRSGDGPSAEHAAALGPIAEWGSYMAATGASAASYTQWEFILPREARKPTFVFFAGPGFPRGPAGGGAVDPENVPLIEQQAKFKTWVEQTGKDRNTFDTLEQLREELLVLLLPDLARPKPMSGRFVSIGSLFKGREAELAALGHALAVEGGGRAAITAKPATVHGLGGVGKTQLAIEFGLAHEEQFSALLFISGETAGALDAGLAGLTKVLDLPEREAREDETRIAATLRWLGGHDGWYLVIDNVDDEHAAQAVEARLAQLHRGSVAVTSRLRSWSRRFTSLELDVLSPSAAVEYLLETTAAGRVDRSNDAAEAAALADDLQYLALGLEQAGAYIAEILVSFAEYRRLWRENFVAANAWFKTLPKGLHDYPHSMEATWLTSFNRLTPEARHLLDRLAWLAPEPIPLTFLEGTDRAPMAELVRFSLSRQVGERADFVVVHRLVQEVTRRRQEDRTALVEVLGEVDRAFAGDPSDVRTWSILDPIATHAATVATFADEQGLTDPTSDLMSDVGGLWIAKARFAEAEPLMRRALAIDEAALGTGHPKVAIRLNDLAVLFRTTNRAGEAELLLSRAVELDAATLGKDDPGVAVRASNLASVFQDTSRASQAEPLFRRALAIDLAVYDHMHPMVAIRLNNLALLLSDLGRPTEAEPLFQQALAIDEAALGTGHPKVAIRLNNLACLFEKTGRVREAEQFYRRALAINEANFGKDHPNVAANLNNLSNLLHATNRPFQAEDLIIRVLAINETAYGEDHHVVARNLQILAGVMSSTFRQADAKPLFRRAAVIISRFEISAGHVHPTHQGTISNYVQCLRDLGLGPTQITRELTAVQADAARGQPGRLTA